jgi:hypothetical protein
VNTYMITIDNIVPVCDIVGAIKVLGIGEFHAAIELTEDQHKQVLAANIYAWVPLKGELS